MVFVTIHLTFLVFPVTGLGVLFAFTEVRLPFLGPSIGALLRLSFVRIFLRHQAGRRNGGSRRRRLADKAHAQGSDQSRPEKERENSKFHGVPTPGAVNQTLLKTDQVANGLLVLRAKIGGIAIPFVSGGFCI